MTTETKVKHVKKDPNSLYQAKEVRVSSSKHIETPIKAVDVTRLASGYPINSSGRGFNEIFKRFDAKQIKKYLEDPKYSGVLDTFFSRQTPKIDSEQVTACFLEFSEDRFPTKDELEFLVDTAYPYSDITPIPIPAIANRIGEYSTAVFRKKLLSDYIQYVKDAISEINAFNNKPIVGIIPKFPMKRIAELLEIYRKNGINSFAIDLDGSNPMSYRTPIFKILKTLKKDGLLEKSFIYGFNIGYRFNKAQPVIPARDILGFGLGLDSIGDKHKRIRGSEEYFKRLRILLEKQGNKFRLFNKADYGYWREIEEEQLQGIYPKDSRINIRLFSDFKGDYQKRMFIQKLFNSEQLSLEARKLKDMILEDPATPLPYVKKKKYVLQQDITEMEKVNKKLEK